MYGLSCRQWMGAVSRSRRAVSRASGVPVARAEIALPFNLLAAGFAPGCEPGATAFFFVAMLLFPPRRLRQNDGRVFSVHPQDRQCESALTGAPLESVSLRNRGEFNGSEARSTHRPHPDGSPPAHGLDCGGFGAAGGAAGPLPNGDAVAARLGPDGGALCRRGVLDG